MPDDVEFEKGLKERDLYGDRILKYLLEQIEIHDNKEVGNLKKLQIEHIMPQTLTEEWKTALGDDWERVHLQHVDRLGNLTLTGYNPEYSNRPFLAKRDMEKGFRDSGLALNRRLSRLDKWGEQEIKTRANELSQRVLEIWRI